MAERFNTSSPLSSSPGARASLDRAVFPWASPSASLRASHRQSQTSLHSIAAPTSASAAASWDPRVIVSPAPGFQGSMSRQTTGGISAFQQDSTRQWNFIGFEWAIRDVARLREFVEGPSPDPASPQTQQQQEDFEVLRNSPIINNRFKLEVAPINVLEETQDLETKPPRLALYLTSLLMETEIAHEMPTTVMVAIKCPGQHGAARPEWFWEQWTDWVFRQESEVWECPLPSVSSLLENERIRQGDSFVLCIQINSPIGPLYPQHPHFSYVNKDLLDGIEASLDNPNTGDVVFVCLERFPADGHSSPISDVPPHSRRSSSSASTSSPYPPRLTARKRIIYAHSDILIRRSEYFATMLQSDFAETSGGSTNDRKFWRVIVEETDFQTMYWVLKYLYASYCTFKENDDPRAAVEGVGSGMSVKWLHSHGGEWDWKVLPRALAGDDHVSIASGESAVSGGEAALSKEVAPFHSAVPSNPTRSATTNRANPLTPSKPTSSVHSNQRSTTQGAVRKGTSHGELSLAEATSSREAKAPTLPISIPAAKFSPQSHYPLSPRSQRNAPSSMPTADPHPHPTPCPAAASALSIYQAAHRYNMPQLANLALEHIMNTVTPDSSLGYLLATSVWDDLRALVEDYVVQQWDEVSNSSEFERCLEEISAGEWGPEGGKVLTRLFRRLRSPIA
ncbi:hypothetical protein DL96DRAFT_1592760 [Flagelloscypha sp. PMI_526]|nr:hypothetical protein DL96DRAFT_1592760 [Flagelloscypha sp. PMI_526]